MTKLRINTTNIEKDVIPNIESAITYLNKAINNVGTLNIPNDFEYDKYLGQLMQKNRDTSNKLVSKKNKIIKTIENYEKASMTNVSNVSDIKNVNLLPRRKMYVTK